MSFKKQKGGRKAPGTTGRRNDFARDGSGPKRLPRGNAPQTSLAELLDPESQRGDATSGLLAR